MDSVYNNAILIDSSAAIAYLSPSDQYHNEAVNFFKTTTDYLWTVLYLTKYESFTTIRYDHPDLRKALEIYNFLSNKNYFLISYNDKDEIEAINLINKYADHTLSFHDALCAAAMKRKGIYKAFSFDRHFFIFGFEVYPGMTY